MKRTRHATPLLLACLLALGAAGCSDDVEPRFEPAPSPSVSATASETPAVDPSPSGPPDLPAAAMKDNAEGAKAFVAYFWDVANYAQSTGDTATFASLGAPTCEGCRGAVSFLDDLYAAGGSIRGGDYTVGTVNPEPLEVEGLDTALFRCSFTTTNSEQTIEQPGKPRRDLPAATTRASFTLSYQADGWQVDVWDVQR